MSFGTEAKDFTFIWEIKNFSMCPMGRGDFMHSTEFMPKRLDHTKWRLSIYPKGKKDEGFISCYLIREMSGKDQMIKIDFSLTIKTTDLSWQMSRKVVGKEFCIGSEFGYDKFCSHSIIDENREIYLPDDTLTINCYILCKDTNIQIGSFSESSQLILKLEYPLPKSPVEELSIYNQLRSMTNSSSPCQSFCLTHIKIWNFSFEWTIKEISKLQPLENIPCDFEFPLPVVLYFSLGEVTGTDDCAQIYIETTKSQKIFLRCHITVASAQIPFQDSTEDEHVYNDDDVWTFKPFLKLDNLKMGDYNDPEKDQITLLCKLSISFGGKKSRYDISNGTSSFDAKHPYILINTGPDDGLLALYQDRKFCDVSLQTEDRAFPAHKGILCNRSSVFYAMFEKDMKEKNSGIVDITDVEADILDRMLKFMYSGVIEDCYRDTILKLYYAADKYDVTSLRKQCSSILKSCLSLSNVCEVLALADLHYDRDLTKAAENFIFIYSNTIFNSIDWKLFTENNPKVSSEIMRSVRLKTYEI